MNPVCAFCALEMVCAYVGVILQTDRCTYQRCDRFSCPGCNVSVLTNFGAQMIVTCPPSEFGDEVVRLKVK